MIVDTALIWGGGVFQRENSPGKAHQQVHAT